MNNSTPFCKTGSTSPVFRTPHSPAGRVNTAVQGLECAIVWQPKATSLLPVIHSAANPYQGTADMFSNNTANFPLQPFPASSEEKETWQTKAPWELSTGCWLSVKNPKHTHRGAEDRLPWQTLFWCFETSLLEIAWEDILLTPVLIISQPQTWLTLEGCWPWSLKASKGCCRVRNCQCLHLQPQSMRSILNKWVTTAGLGLRSKKVPQALFRSNLPPVTVHNTFRTQQEVCCLWQEEKEKTLHRPHLTAPFLIQTEVLH